MKRIGFHGNPVWIGVFLILTLVVPVTAYAGQADTAATCYEMKPAKDTEHIYVSVLATEETELLGFSGELSFDEDVFSVSGIYPAKGFYFAENNESNMLALYAVDTVGLNAGDELFTLQFDASDAISSDAEYAFSVAVTEAYGEDMEDYPWVPDTIETVYRDSTADTIDYEPPVSDVAYTVTFQDEDGTVLSIDSVDKEDPYVQVYEPEREGVVFDGWLMDGKAFDADAEIDSNITLTASWTANGDDTEQSAAHDESPAGQEEKLQSNRNSVILTGVCVAAVVVVLLIVLTIMKKKQQQKKNE